MRVSVCVAFFSAVVIWRISTRFLSAINLQGKVNSSSSLTLVLIGLCQLYCEESCLQPYIDRYNIMTKSSIIL